MRWHHTLSTAGKKKKRENKFPFCFLSPSACTRSVWSGGGLECEHNCQQIAFDSNVSWRLLLLLPYRLKNRIPTPKWQSVGGSFWDSFYRLLFGVPPQSLSLRERRKNIMSFVNVPAKGFLYSLYTALLYNILHRSRPGPYVRYRHYKQHLRRTHFVYYNIYSRYYLVCPFLDRHIHIFRFTWTLFFLLRNIIGLGYLSSLNNSAHADD